MLYYSEKNKKFYKTESDLQEAEKNYDVVQAEAAKVSEEKKKRAKEVGEAYAEAQRVRKDASAAIKKADDDYYSLRNKFVKDYGSFHVSYFNDDEGENTDDVIARLSKVLSYWPFVDFH